MRQHTTSYGKFQHNMAVATTEHHVVNIQKVMLISKTNKSEVKLFWHTILCGKVHERQLLTVFFPVLLFTGLLSFLSVGRSFSSISYTSRFGWMKEPV